MKKFNGYNEAKKAAQYTGGRLPAGAYVCKIMGVRYEEHDDMLDVIVLQFDITEGDQAEYFKNQYANNIDENKKWKGTARIYCPSDDGTEKDAWTKKSFARWTNAFEDSNHGYTWDWDEDKWKDKFVGIIFGETGTVINGKEVVYTGPRTACSVEDARTGKYWDGFTQFKAKNGYTGNQQSTSVKTDANGFMDIPSGTDDEIPF